MKTIYTDHYGSIETTIVTTLGTNGKFCMTMNLNELSFKGSSFDDFMLLNSETYDKSDLLRFTFHPCAAYDSNDKWLELCNCSFAIYVPTIIIDKETKDEITTFLLLDLTLGLPAPNGGIDYERAEFSIEINGEHFQSQADVVEIGLDKLRKQFETRYHFKNCYGCMYSDYSPYGQGFLGDMLCFKAQKKAYLALSNNFSKEVYFDLIDQGFSFVQETYCCDQYEQRSPNTGYRG